jgi:hypothetical protein
MKFVYCCDLHLKAENPKARIDEDFTETILNKLREVFQYGKDHQVDCIILGGDIFHTCNPSITTVNRFVELCSDFAEIPIHCCIGNHDIIGHNLTTVENTGVGLLNKFFLDTNPPESDIKTSFMHYNHDIEEQLATPNFFEPCILAVSHAMLTENEFFGNYVKYTDIEQPFRVMMASHYHPGFGIKKHNGRIFVAPGAITRGALTEDNITRQPSFVYGDITNTGINSLKIIPIQCARLAEEVFNLNINKDLKNNGPTMDITELNKLEFTGLDPVTMLVETAKNVGLRQQVLEECLSRI